MEIGQTIGFDSYDSIRVSKRNKKAKNKKYAKPGSLLFLANKKRRLLTTNEIVEAIQSEKGQLLKLIEKQPVATQSEVNGQSVEAQTFKDHLFEQQPVEDQVQRNFVTPPTDEQPEEQAEGIPTKNTRGKTQLPKVHSRQERKLILLNSLNQSVGPTEDVVTDLSSFLGTLARNVTPCPFDIFDWRNMDTTKDLWNYTKEKYIIPDAAKAWTLLTIPNAWKSQRTELKRTYHDPYDNDEVQMSKKSGHIPQCQFRELLKYWKSEKFKLYCYDDREYHVENREYHVEKNYKMDAEIENECDKLSEAYYKMSETNTKNRKNLMNLHTAGKKSFVVIRNRLEKDKETVSSKELFVVTRTRNPNRVYKASYENTASKIAEMEELETQTSANSQSVDSFSAIMGPEHPGRLRLYGAGVTKTTLKKIVGNFEPNLNATNSVVQQMEERIQKMEKQMEEQKRNMRQEVIADVIAQLHHAGLIEPNIIAALFVPSQREVASAQAAEQGDGIEEGDESAADDLT